MIGRGVDVARHRHFRNGSRNESVMRLSGGIALSSVLRGATKWKRSRSMVTHLHTSEWPDPLDGLSINVSLSWPFRRFLRGFPLPKQLRCATSDLVIRLQARPYVHESPMLAGQKPDDLATLAEGDVDDCTNRGATEAQLVEIAGYVNGRQHMIVALAAILALLGDHQRRHDHHTLSLGGSGRLPSTSPYLTSPRLTRTVRHQERGALPPRFGFSCLTDGG